MATAVYTVTPEKRREYSQNSQAKHGNALWRQQVIYRSIKNVRMPTMNMMERYQFTKEELEPVIDAIRKAYEM